jgi:hypothetical protein
MEGMSQVESVERGDVWRELKEQAPAQAAELIASIPDFESMDADTQIATLEAHIEALARENSNRFLAKEIARTIETIRANVDFANRMRALEVVA